jgi:DNA-binding transcriptional regulator YiaG
MGDPESRDDLGAVPAIVKVTRQQGVDMTTKKWSEIRAQKLTPAELREIDREIEGELLEMDLRAVREAVGLTQGELAQRIEITQSQLSKMERREDHRISTLRRYVQALGGSLEICAVIDGKRIKLAEG